MDFDQQLPPAFPCSPVYGTLKSEPRVDQKWIIRVAAPVNFPLPRFSYTRTTPHSNFYHPSHLIMIIATDQSLHYRRNELWNMDAFNILTFRVHLDCLSLPHFSPFLLSVQPTTHTHSLTSTYLLPPFFCHYNSGYRSMDLKSSGPSKKASH
jgi:hypothetical protein